MAIEQFDFEVHSPEEFPESHSFTITIHVPVPEEGKQSGVLNYLRSKQLKEDVVNNWVRKNATGYGIEIRNGPRPVHSVDNDRNSPVIAYEQDFRLTRPI